MTLRYVIVAASLALATAACATSGPYGPAAKEGAKGYSEQPIESNRYRVSYRDVDAQTAQNRALRRAAEIAVRDGADWFEVVNAYTEQDVSRGRSGSSVSIGGSSGSYGGSSSVGVGLGIGIPLGGGSTQPVTHVLEILTGSGPQPAGSNVYDADEVLMNLSGF